MPENPYLTSRMRGFGTTIFAQMSALAVATQAVNLGQGFPDTDGPPEILDAAIAAIRAGHNQYPPGIGIPELRLAVAEHQKRFYDISLAPDTEVLITAGATEAITAALLALCEFGDEVVVFEPYYDSYAAAIAMAGAHRRCVPLRPPDYSFAPEDLEAAITDRTRLILLNSPHNPTGKVFSRDELAHIASLAAEHDLLVVTDEVYEHIVFEGEHLPIATFPQMAERTVTVSSAGKTFSVTGWKIGWICASEELVKACQTTKQFLTYVNGAPFQHAIALGLRLGDDYFKELARNLHMRKDELSAGLREAGMEVHQSHGTYFVIADISNFAENGLEFCLGLPERCGVVAVPVQVFCDDADLGAPLARFAFCKKPEVIAEAVTRLAKMRTSNAAPQS